MKKVECVFNTEENSKNWGRMQYASALYYYMLSHCPQLQTKMGHWSFYIPVDLYCCSYCFKTPLSIES